jgi:hypothetical protein
MDPRSAMTKVYRDRVVEMQAADGDTAFGRP